MKKRNPIAVLLLPFVTFGIYSLYWFVKTKGEMNERGANIPTAWLIIVPFVNLWWTWKYCEGVEKVTNGKLNGLLCLVLLLVVGPIGGAIIQDSFNNNVAPLANAEVPDSAAPVTPPVQSVAPTESTPPAETALQTPATDSGETAPEVPAETPTQSVPEQVTDSETENKDQTPPPAAPAA